MIRADMNCFNSCFFFLLLLLLFCFLCAMRLLKLGVSPSDVRPLTFKGSKCGTAYTSRSCGCTPGIKLLSCHVRVIVSYLVISARCMLLLVISAMCVLLLAI